MSEKILVIGGTGKTGKRVAERLALRNIPYRIGSRNGQPPFDWAKPETFDAALNGISKAYISFQPDLAAPGADAAISALVAAARRAGLRQLVLLSGRGEPEAQVCERIVMESGMEWTVLRANWFMQNFSENFFLDGILAGEVVVPEVRAKEPFVDCDDIADVAVAALTNDAHKGKMYELTGPELLDFGQVIAGISKVANRPIAFRSVPIGDYTGMLRQYQVPEDFIQLIEYLFTQVLDGRNESLTGDIETVLHRQPTSFAEYLEKTVKTGVWNPENLSK